MRELFSTSFACMGMRMRWVVEDYEALAPGRLVLRLCRGLQVSQLQLAELAGVPRSLVGRVESGGDVQLGSPRRLLGALGCRLVVLPASEELLSRFKAKAKEKRRRDREWKRVRRSLETKTTQRTGRNET